VISPFAKPSRLEPTDYDLVSILKFLEVNFGLPTLASVNPMFDRRRPAVPTTRPPRATRRDHRRRHETGSSDLMECFSF
jgi:hypothetical protein